jgi:hypothetical protein
MWPVTDFLDGVYFQNMARDLQLGNPRLQGSLVHASNIQLRHELQILESQCSREQID